MPLKTFNFSEWAKKKKEEEEEKKSQLTQQEKAMGGIGDDNTELQDFNFSEWAKRRFAEANEETYAPVPPAAEYVARTTGVMPSVVDVVNDDVQEKTWTKNAKGNVAQQILGTVGDTALGLVTGFGELNESIYDLAVLGISRAADALGADEVAEKLQQHAEDEWMRDWAKDKVDYVDQYSTLGGKSDTLVEGVGGALAQVVWGGAHSFAPTIATGLSSAGSGVVEAYKNDATHEQAWAYGLGKGVSEALIEAVSGGLGKGFKALGVSRGIGGLDDMFAKKAADTFFKAISNETVQKVLGNTAEAAIKAGGEALEEFASAHMDAFLQWLTYRSDEDLKTLIKDSNALESAMYGFLTSGIMQGADVIKSTASKTDYVTGMTSAEEKVINKAAEQEIAKREANGEKLTKKQKNEIYDRFAEDISRGYISIDTIEEALGGDKYTEYKKASDENATLKKELDELRNMESGKMNDIQRERLTELKAMNLDDTSKIDELKKQMSDDVLNLVKSERKGQGSLLMESYNEKARRGEGYTVDLNTIDSKKQDTYKRAMDAGILNNTNRTHDFVDLIATLESDRGVKIDFVNNQKLKESGFAVDGAIVNGVKTDNGILLNVESGKTLDTVVGHEIAHVLEGTELYSALQDSIIKYAQSKGDYDTRYANIAKLYKTDDDIKIKSELTADLVGDYLFTDEKFIKSLTANPNVFQKVFNEIKYLVKISTSGSEAKRKLLDVQRAFERAWADTKATKNTTNEGGVNANAEYSLSKNARDDVHNALYNKTIQGDIKLTDNSPTIMLAHEGVKNLPMLMKASHIRENVFTEAEAKKYGLRINPNINYHGLGEDLFLEIVDDLDNVTEAYRGTKNAENSDRRENYFLLISKKTDKDGNVINVPVYINEKGQYNRVFVDTNKIATVYGKSELRQYINEQLKAKNLVRIKTRSTQASESTSPIKADYGMDASVDSISQNSEKSSGLENISENSDIAPTQFSLSDSNGKQLSKEQQEYFQDSKVRDENGNLKVMYHGTHESFTTFDRAKAKSNGTYGNGFYFSDSDSHAGTYGNLHEVYLNITNPLKAGERSITRDQLRSFVQEIADNEDYGIENYGYGATVDSVVESVYGRDDFAMLLDLNITAIGNMVEAIELFNAVNGTDYDGIIAPTETVAFYPEQVKSIDNTKPTSDPDIRYSLSNIDDIAPVGKYSNLGIQEDIAPLTMDSVDTMGGVDTNAYPNAPTPTDADAPPARKGEKDIDTKSMFVDPAKKEHKKANWWNTLRTHVLDDASVFEDLAKKTKNRELEAKFNFIKSAEARAQSLIGNGKKEAGVKSLNSIRQTVEKMGKTADFEDYMYHLLNIDRMTLADRYEGATNKPVFDKDITADISEAKVRQYEAQNPQFKSLAEDVYKYMQYERQLMVDNGIISQETADKWQEQTPHYIPIKRSVADDSPVNTSGKKKINVDSTVKRVKGGDQPIEHLFDTIASRTERVFSSIAKNNFGLELKNTLNSVIDSNTATQDDVDNGVDRHDDLLQAGKDGRNPTFTVFENGEKVTFEISHDMYEALKPTEEMWRGTSKVMNKINNIRRGLLTEYSPAFMVSNPIRDTQDVLFNSQHALKTYENFPKAIKELKTKGKWFTEYIENGGEQNSYFEKGDGFKKDDTGIKKLIGIPLNAISNANQFIERIPRLAEYIASRENGASIETAMLDAARVTTNFQAGGDITKFLNRNGFTFLNASVQGLMQNVRNVREAKMNGLKGVFQLIGKTMFYGFGALIANHLMWGDDEEYEELSDYVKDNYYILVKYGDGTFVRIPKGRTAAVIQDAFEQMANLITGNDEVDLESFFELVMNNLAPNNPLENNIIAPLTQAWSNTTWYGDDLVPTRLQDLPAGEQYDESIDSISKWLGEKTNISPYKINYVLDQYSGAVGDFVLPMLTPEAERGENALLAPLADKFTTDSTMKNQNVSDFYDTADELTVNANSSKATDEDVLKSKYMNSINSELSELYKQKREIQNSDLSNSAKYNAVREVQKQINDLAKQSLDTYGEVYINGDYASVGDRHYHKNTDGEWQKITDEQLEKMDKVTKGLGISASEYWANKKEYDFAYTYPEKYDFLQELGVSFEEYTKDQELTMFYTGENRKKYDWMYENSDKYDWFTDNGIAYDDYAESEDSKYAYNWAYDNPDLYKVAKAVTDDVVTYKQYTKAINAIKGVDKNGDGKSDKDSRKDPVINYLKTLGIEDGAWKILFRSEFKSDNRYNYDIVKYLEAKEGLTYEEKLEILKALGMEVDQNGNIWW